MSRGLLCHVPTSCSIGERAATRPGMLVRSHPLGSGRQQGERRAPGLPASP